MKYKIKPIMIFFLLAFSIFTIINFNNPSIYIAGANEVVYENEYGRMIVWPETSSNLIRQEQYCNITWFKPDNTIDVAFRFNQVLTGGKIQYWNNNQWNTVTLSHTTYNNLHYYYYQGFNVKQDTTYRFRWYYNVQPGSSGKWDFLAKLSSDTIQEAFDSGRYVMLDPWWNSDWAKRKDIYIDKDQLKNSVKNFPILVNLSDAEMVGDVQVDLGDIAFVDTVNGTKFSHEIEKYNVGSTVDAIIWVKISVINGSDHVDDTHINMYYDNAGCANQDNPTGVWDSNYLMVYHMNSSTTTTKGCYDSTSNAAHGTFTGDLPTTATGIAGDGQHPDGTGDWITESNTAGATQLDGTWEIWFNTQEHNGNDCLISFYTGADEFIFYNLRQDLGPPEEYAFRGDFGDTQWNDKYVSGMNPFSWNSTGQHWADGDEINIWLDGNLVDTDGSVDTVNIGGGNWYIGSFNGASEPYDGIIDEVRFSKTKRNNTWMEASYNTIKNDTTFVMIGVEKEDVFTSPVTSVTVETQSKTYIAVNWTKGNNGEYTLVERNTSSSWTRGEGTQLYNGTDNSYNDTNCTVSTVYYYQLWAFNVTTKDFSSVEGGNDHTGPTIPTSVTIGISGNTITIGWTKGTRTNNTIVMRKTGGYPTVVGDGTEIYNSTGTSHVDTGWNNNLYYTLFSYNTYVNIASNGVNIPEYGALNITAKNASNNNTITSFWVTVSNQSGSEVYDSASTGSYANIGIDVLPTGDNVMIQVNATGYKNAIYCIDIISGNYYALTAYLSPTTFITDETDCILRTYIDSLLITNPDANGIITFTHTLEEMISVEVYNNSLYVTYGGWIFVPSNNYSFTTTQLTIGHGVFDVNTTMARVNYYYESCEEIETKSYALRVINEFGLPIEDVKIKIKRIIGGIYQDVGISFTDADGYIYAYLIPDINYIINITKTGYQGTDENYNPDPDYYGIYYPKIFRLKKEIIGIKSVSFGDVCWLDGEWITSNNSLLVTFTDKLGLTTNIQFYIYETYNGTQILNSTQSFTGQSNITFYVEGLNTSRAHDIIIFHNHSQIGYTENFVITVMPIRTDVLESDWIEDQLKSAFGEFDLGYVNTFAIWFPAIVILIAGCVIGQPGIGVTGMSFWAVLLNWKLETELDANLYILFSLLLILGFIAIIIQNRRH